MKRVKVKLTNFQLEILKIMEQKDTFTLPKWGFSAMGFREISKIIGKSPTSVSNAMRSMYDKGIFFDCTSENQYDDTTYFLANPEILDKPGKLYK